MTDEEILARIAESRENTRRELREELESLFKKEKDSLLERAQLFMSVAKWSAAALAIGFGLLGIKAWSDVKANIEEYFKAQLNNAYRIDDPTSPLARSIDQLMDRAVLNSLYVRALRERDSTNLQYQRRIGNKEDL